MNDVWVAAGQLGHAFADSPVVGRVQAEVDAARHIDARESHHHVLSTVITSGPFAAQPLLLGWWLPLTPQGRELAAIPEARAFLDDAAQVSAAFLGTIEWLRSWLRGYPSKLFLPHLDAMASRVADRGFPDSHLPWPMELRLAGFKFKPEITHEVAAMLEIPPRRLTLPLLDLRRALWSSSAWKEFASASSALTKADEAHLRELVLAFRTGVTELGRGRRRLMHYQESVRAELRTVETRARGADLLAAYYRAFRGLDRALEAVGSLISQMAGGEEIQSIEPQQASWIEDEERLVRFVLVNQPVFPRINAILHIRNDIDQLRRLVRVVGTSITFSQRRGEQLRASAVTVEDGVEALIPPKNPSESEFLERIRTQVD